jgi:hypothetical protein
VSATASTASKGVLIDLSCLWLLTSRQIKGPVQQVSIRMAAGKRDIYCVPHPIITDDI